MLGDGFDSGLAAQLFVVLQLEIIVFGVKDDKLIVSIDINDGNEIGDERVLGLFYEWFTTWCSSCPLRFVNQINKLFMSYITVLLSQRYRKSKSADWLL